MKASKPAVKKLISKKKVKPVRRGGKAVKKTAKKNK